ncbi:MAG: glycosyltransferase family 4 protein [Phycisphaerales bacterium]|nr:MAG: glycosyltransferase family 4 protein [Phycisphaerales bacterium]
MRVVYLAAGAGSTYCGSCLRDNRLAATLRAQGRDVVLLPMYMPIRTDEHDVSEPDVCYGGINVYLQQKSRLFGLLPSLVDSTLDSPVLLRRAGRWATRAAPETLGQMTISILRGEHGAQRKELRKLIRKLSTLRPALVNLPNLMFVGIAAPLKEALGVPVLCTLSGEDIFLDKLPEADRARAIDLIREATDNADGFIAPTHYYANVAAERFAVPRGRLHLIPMGIDVATFENCTPPPTDAPFTIGYLARICHDKGLHLLCDAVAKIRQAGRNIRLCVAGTLAPQDRPYWQELQGRLPAGEFEYGGEVDHAGKLRFFGSIHVLSVPTVYHESKGLYILEALAAGVPVVQPGHGSFPELLEATGGGLLCHPNDADDLATCILQLMDQPILRARLGRAGREAVRERFTDSLMAQRTWAVYELYAGTAHPGLDTPTP